MKKTKTGKASENKICSKEAKRANSIYSTALTVRVLAGKEFRKFLRVLRKSFKLILQRKVNYISKKQRATEETTVFSKNIKFSLLVPVFDTPKDELREMMNSVKAQTYKNWELCIADCSNTKHSEVEKTIKKYTETDNRIVHKIITGNPSLSEIANECIDMSSGDFLCLLNPQDVLSPSALFQCMRAICENDADFIYSDEDKIKSLKSKPFNPHYKPDFAIDNLRATNYIGDFAVFKKDLLNNAGVFKDEFNDCCVYDLILRLTEHAKHIVHIPKTLYHRRAIENPVNFSSNVATQKNESGIAAVADHLKRVGLKGNVTRSPLSDNVCKIEYEIIGNPLVSIIIPNYNHIKELSRCIDSILNLSTYKNYEIIIVENNSNEETFEYYESLKKHSNIKVEVYKPVAGFNYSAINNFGVQFANGEHYILLNNDVEVITPNWIEEMLMFSQRKDVGCVGAMLYYPDDTIQHAGVILGLLGLAGHAFKHYPRNSTGYFGRASYQQNLSAVTAACLMLSADIYKAVGGFDETFEVAFNDVDFCLRIREKGYLNVFTPFAELYHHESISRGNEDTPAKRKRQAGEINRFKAKWSDILEAGDPYYNPNLTLETEDFSIKY